MTWMSDRIFCRPRVRGPDAYDRAMQATGELIERFEEASRSPDPIRAMFADMWLERHNIPYATTMFQSHQEMISPLRTGGDAKR